jgi:YfiH family protein
MSSFSEVKKGVYLLEGMGKKVVAGFSGREYPKEASAAFLKELKIADFKFFTLKQIHSANIVRVRSDHGQHKPSADGMLTTDKKVILGIWTADCVPVYYYDPKHEIIGLCHAGWKGTHFGIAEKMIQAMVQNFESNASEILVTMGPYIHPCCYEVGEEFSEIFPKSYKRKDKRSKGFMDLGAEIRKRLMSEGVLKKNIQDTEICTVCKKSKFYSYRAEPKTTERILSVISFKA